MIEEIGYEVVAASSGSDALFHFTRETFSLVLTDVVMPQMSGVELAGRIRKIAPDLPVLFASGYADVEMFGRELAFETVLKKPYRIGEIAARIGEALANGGQRSLALGAISS